MAEACAGLYARKNDKHRVRIVAQGRAASRQSGCDAYIQTATRHNQQPRAKDGQNRIRHDNYAVARNFYI